MRQAAAGVALCVSLSMVACEGGQSPTSPAVRKPSPALKPAPTEKAAPAEKAGQHDRGVAKSGSTDEHASPPPRPVPVDSAATTPAPPVAPALPADKARTRPASIAQPEQRVDDAAAALAATRSDVLFELTSLRSQIDQYNEQNPEKPYDGRTKLDTFWDPLMKGTYLLKAPMNPLQKSAKVGSSPAPGIGWVWAHRQGMLRLDAVDESGGRLVESASSAQGLSRAGSAALDAQQTTRRALGAVRAAMLEFYDKKVMETGQGRWPTLAELRGKSIMPEGIPENPYNRDKRIAPATYREAVSRAVVGKGEGWAYYDGSGGGQPVFYANTRMVGQNIW